MRTAAVVTVVLIAICVIFDAFYPTGVVSGQAAVGQLNGSNVDYIASQMVMKIPAMVHKLIILAIVATWVITFLTHVFHNKKVETE